MYVTDTSRADTAMEARRGNCWNPVIGEIRPDHTRPVNPVVGIDAIIIRVDLLRDR
jgi:hypothetical protein